MTASFRTRTWEQPDWQALSPAAQLYAMTAKAVNTRSRATLERVAALTGWPESFITAAEAEVRDSNFASLLSFRRSPLPRRLREAVYARDGRVCAFCEATTNLQIDHRHPVALGGSDEMTNLQVLCQPCNTRKGARIGVVQGG